jgi:hypothetical protein
MIKIKKLCEIVAEHKGISNTKARQLIRQGAVSVGKRKLTIECAEYWICDKESAEKYKDSVVSGALNIGKSQYKLSVLSNYFEFIMVYMLDNVEKIEFKNNFDVINMKRVKYKEDTDDLMAIILRSMILDGIIE